MSEDWRNHLESAKLYELLAQYYRFTDGNKHSEYEQKYAAELHKLAQAYTGLAEQGRELWSERGGELRDNEAKAKVRFLHISPGLPAADVYAGGQLLVPAIPYQKLTDYITLAPGTYRIELHPTGQRSKPLLQSNVTVTQGERSTLAVGGSPQDLQLFTLADQPPEARRAATVRFVHFAPQAPILDVAIKGGASLFVGVPFRHQTAYITYHSSPVTLEIRQAGTNQVLLEVPETGFLPGHSYSILAAGQYGGYPPFEAVLISDDDSLI